MIFFNMFETLEQMITNEYLLISLASLAFAFNLWHGKAQQGAADIGVVFYKTGPLFEMFNWLLLTAALIWLSYSYTWWFLLLGWILLPIPGVILFVIFRSLIQLVYIVGMPILLILIIVGSFN